MISSLELARLCGLSQGTVDRALHNRPGISEKTKAKIVALAARHGYRPHPAARELLTGERRTVVGIVPGVNSVFFMDLMHALRSALAPAGFRFIVTQVNDDAEFSDALGHFAALRARAVVTVPPTRTAVVPDEVARDMDVMAVINPVIGSRVRNLMPDEIKTGQIAGEYLAGMGHRQTLHVRPTRDTQAIINRARGYVLAIEKRRLPARVMIDLDAEALTRQVRDEGITALFCHNDWLALAAIRVLNQAGLRVPEDVSVLGVDNSPTFVALCPEITTLHYPAESVAEAVLALIEHRPIPTINDFKLVERKTVRRIGPAPRARTQAMPA